MSNVLGALERSLERAAGLALGHIAGSGHRPASGRARSPKRRDGQHPCFPGSVAPADGCFPGSPVPDDGCFTPEQMHPR